MDDPASAKNLSKVIWTQDILHNQAIRKAPHLRLTPPWPVWTNHCPVAVGNASNTSSNDERSSEKYAAGGRSRFNLTDYDYLFGQASWLTDRYNGYRERDVLTAGYGRQFWMARYTVSALNSVRVRYDKYTDNASETQPLGYASGAYAWQLTDNAKFTQGVSVFGAEDTTLNSESALNVAINEHFGLKVAYNVTWNSEPPESAPEHTDRRTTLSLGYSM